MAYFKTISFKPPSELRKVRLYYVWASTPWWQFKKKEYRKYKLACCIQLEVSIRHMKEASAKGNRVLEEKIAEQLFRDQGLRPNQRWH